MTLYARLLEIVNSRELNNALNISLRHRYVYGAVPKCASTTLKTALNTMELDGTGLVLEAAHRGPLASPFVRPFQLDEAYLEETLKGDGVFRFAVVRNPFVRALSGYLDKMRWRSPQRRQLLKVMGRDPEEPNPKIDFPTFVETIGAQTPRAMNRHWRPQTVQLLMSEVSYHYIGRLERLGEALDVIESKLGPTFRASLPAKSVGPSSNAASQIADFYTEATAERVREIFADDFETFGYSPDLPG